MPTDQHSFFQLASTNWNRIGCRAAVFSLIVSLFGAFGDALEWVQEGRLGPVLWGYVAVQLLLIFGAVYLSASDILGSKPSWLGLARFVIATGALFLPLVLTFCTLFLIKPFVPGEGRLTILLLGVFVGLAIIALLTAWPIAQSLHTALVSPAAIFRATKGYRWGLILAFFTLGAINKADFIPKMKTANNVGEFVIIGAGHIMLGLVSIVFTASIAATALGFAARHDESLMVSVGS